MNPKSIWSEAQNKPTLIARDFWNQYRIPAHATYEILLRRGVFKWMGVRRQLITFRHNVKHAITGVLRAYTKARRNGTMSPVDKGYYRGYLDALQWVLQKTGDMAHGERWQAPDNDRYANLWLQHRMGNDYSPHLWTEV